MEAGFREVVRGVCEASGRMGGGGSELPNMLNSFCFCVFVCKFDGALCMCAGV